MTQFLLCPFISTSIHNWACHRESCALWLPNSGHCAIKALTIAALPLGAEHQLPEKPKAAAAKKKKP
jgi:hypothetical protein